MENKWANLPNATHINRVLESARVDRKPWDDVTGETLPWHESWNLAWNIVYDSCREDTWEDGATGLGYHVADAIVALIAWDDCAYMLDSDPGELAILAAFGDPRAILLLPACQVFAEEKELKEIK